MIPPLAALISWPVIGLAIFRTNPIAYAVVLTVMGGFLFLPDRVAIDLPLLPTLTKHVIPALVAFVLALAFATPRTGLPGIIPRNPLPAALLTLYVVSGFFTTLANQDAIQIGGTILPGLRLYDALSLIMVSALVALPMLLGRKFLSDASGHHIIIICFAVAAMVYVPLIWVELVLSPQINRWTYGFFPHSWIQHVRAGGYRPLVFLSHGLQLALFLCMALVCAVSLWWLAPAKRGLVSAAVVILALTLVLSKSLGALIIACLLVPLAAFVSARLQLLAAAIIGVFVLAYPVARTLDVVKPEALQNAIAPYNEQRAASFGTRLRNEDILLDRASERPLFGWGGWGRSRVLNEAGRDITIADGHWIISYGVGGATKYFSEFGLLVIPLVLLFFRGRKYAITRETATLALILAANLIDLIPNSGMSPLTWLIVGALWGRLERGTDTATAGDPVGVDTASSRRPGYRRPGAEPTQEPAFEPDLEPALATRGHAYTRQTERKTRHQRVHHRRRPKHT